MTPRIVGGELTAPSRADAVTLLTALGSSYTGQVRVVVDGETTTRLAWVGSAIEDLSGYERADGGFGVVASVDSATEVTLAAGYTLGAAGRCRLWDVSGSTHIDGGGVPWTRSGAVVTLPSTTTLAAGDVVYSDRLEVTSYAAATALETALGTAFNGEIRVVNKTSGAVILRRIVRDGAWMSTEVNFAAVSASKYGLVAAVVDGTTATLTAGHTMPASGTAYVWDTSAAAAIGTAVAFTVVGDTMTVADTTGWAAGDQVWIADTELCVGPSTCAVQLVAGATFRFTGTGIAYLGEWLPRFAPLFLSSRKPCAFLDGLTYTAPESAGDENTIGWRTSNLASRVSAGFGVDGAGLVRFGANSVFNGSAADGVQTSLSVVWMTRTAAGGGTAAFAGGGSSSTNVAASATMVEATYLNGPISVRSTLGATATGMRLQ